MNDFIGQLNGLSAHWFEAVVRASWKGGLGLLLAFAACRFAPGLSPALRCWILKVAYLNIAVALCWSSPIELRLLPAPPAPPPAAPAIVSPVSVTTPENLPTQIEAPARTPLQMVTVLFILWTAGVLCCAVLVIRDLRRLRALSRGCTPVDDAWVLHCATELSRQLHLRNPPGLLASASSSVPFVFGVFKPAVVLPIAMLHQSRGSALRLALAHELAHIKRRDLSWAWMLMLVESVFFFHPLIWLARRESRTIQEMACDAVAMRTASAGVGDYSRMLLSVVAGANPLSVAPRLTTAAIFETKQTLERRIKGMTFNKRNPVMTISAIIALLVLVPVGLLPWRVVAQKAAEPKIDSSKAETPAPAAEEITLLEKEISLAREEVAAERNKLDAGRTTPQVMLERQRELFLLQQELARLKGDVTAEERTLREAIAAAKELSKEISRRVELGTLPVGEANGFQRELIRLERDLQALKRRSPAESSSAESPVRILEPEAVPIPTTGARRPTRLAAPVSGVVTEVLVKANDKVKPGQILLKFDDREAKVKLQGAEAQLAAAEASLKLEEFEMKGKIPEYRQSRLEKVRAELGFAKSQVELAQLAVQSLALRAPRDGKVLVVHAAVGEFVVPDTSRPLVVIEH